MNDSLIKKGFILSGIVNIIGTLIFTKFLTNTYIPEADPVVMSNFGLFMIMVWGLAFLAMSNSYKKAKWVVAVFSVEKITYVVCWCIWISKNNKTFTYDN